MDKDDEERILDFVEKQVGDIYFYIIIIKVIVMEN